MKVKLYRNHTKVYLQKQKDDKAAYFKTRDVRPEEGSAVHFAPPALAPSSADRNIYLKYIYTLCFHNVNRTKPRHPI